jgi:hypothetical protein
MRGKWLNFILLLTNRIYERKQSIIGRVGLGVLIDILILIFLEILLAVVSLPLYFGVKTSGVLAFFEEKGGYDKISSDYKLRRVLTLTGVSIVFVIWLIKFLLILLTPSVYGPLNLYSLSELEPLDISRRELIIQDTGIQTSKVVNTIEVPTVDIVDRKNANNYVLSGTGKVGETVVLFLVEDRTLMYSSVVDKDGRWSVEHSQKDIKLQDGIHSVFVFHYDKENQVRSISSNEQYFRVKEGFIDNLSRNVDKTANWSVAIFIAIGVFLTFLTI